MDFIEADLNKIIEAGAYIIALHYNTQTKNIKHRSTFDIAHKTIDVVRFPAT